MSLSPESSRRFIANIWRPERISSRPTLSIRKPFRWPITGWSRWLRAVESRRGDAPAARPRESWLHHRAGFVLWPARSGRPPRHRPFPRTSTIPRRAARPYDELAAAYYDQARGLLDGGADSCWSRPSSIRLNAKAAFFAIQKLFEERGIARLPGVAVDPAPAESVPDHGLGHLHPSRQQSRRHRPNGRRLLEFHLACAAVERRDELRAGPEGNAAAD